MEVDFEMQKPEIPRKISESEIFDDDPSEMLPNKKPSSNLKIATNSDSSDEESTPVLKIKRRFKRFSDSESDTEKENDQQTKNILSDNEDDLKKKVHSKERMILPPKDDTDSESDKQIVKNEEQQLRMKNKRHKLREKFKNLVTSRTKDGLSKDADSDDEQNNSGDSSNDEESSINNIKQEIKKRMSFKPSICDPDTSDEDENEDRRESVMSKSLNQRKSTKSTSPKPLRMTAKQAMENMKKIKSESNRLLREKEISLPYHRPKGLSLKDIMSRRKAAVTADGKALPIKMNDEQLKQYARMLEQRQKDIIELCKSESDEDQDSTYVSGDNEQRQHCQNLENIESEALDSRNQLTKTCTDDSEKSKENLIKIDEIPKSAEDSSQINIELEKDCTLKDNDILNISNLNTENMVIDSIDKPDNIIENGITGEIIHQNIIALEQMSKTCIEPGSQNLKLYFDSESSTVIDDNTKDNLNEPEQNENKLHENDFSDDDIDMEDIDRLIENAEIMKEETFGQYTKTSIVNKAHAPLNIKPKITGVPGMVINLDDSDSSKNISGVELLKERYNYFAKLKTPEELEREKEKTLMPGAQHLKLKQELEEIIAEQRSIEWAKRLNDEMELKALRGEEADVEEDIEKIEAEIEEKNIENEETSEEESEPEEENDELTEANEKPKNKNPMIDDEAEESDCDDDIEDKRPDLNAEDIGANGEDNETSCEDQSSEESSDDESEYEEQTNKIRKGRILKAFEDSDEETVDKGVIQTDSIEVFIDKSNDEKEQSNATDNDCCAQKNTINDMEVDTANKSQVLKDSQDEEIQLAQRMVSTSDDMFTSQGSSSVPKDNSQYDESLLGTQTFSILNPNNGVQDVLSNIQSMDKMGFITDTQTLDNHLEAAVALCSGTFSQNIIPSQILSSQQPLEQSQAIGEDILALCTGKFYDNNFISQSEEGKADSGTLYEAINDNINDSWPKGESQDKDINILADNNCTLKNIDDTKDNNGTKHRDVSEYNDELRDKPEGIDKQKNKDSNLLQSIIDELHQENTESSKPNKYFVGSNTACETNNLLKKKLIIESDEEVNEDPNGQKKKKKLKKRKLEQRVLQISDDEEEEQSDGEEYISEEDDPIERVVDYDSEENEIEVKPQNPKKKNKAADFFENEAELTSEDEWVGSGDEDEADLDRMEREEGDDETFNQGKLQRKLGQIHMRDVLDQDKREVRLIQELLFEDGDLGGGHRQRKFRWKNAGDDEDTGMVADEFADTQEEEFESEEQWRKQRHEREVFLRQMQEQDKKEDTSDVTLNRSTIIKANLSSKTMSSLLLEVNKPIMKNHERNEVTTQKTTKDIPSPKMGFTILQQNYHSSLLTRGRGALARLAALATPLAVDEDSTKVAAVAPKNQRNFVFTAVTKEDEEPKVTKRKADSKLDTPRLVKKLKTNEKHTLSRNSLLDHLRV